MRRLAASLALLLSLPARAVHLCDAKPGCEAGASDPLGLSLSPRDETVLAEGMVITLEPGVETGPGRLMVHEENIVIRAGGAERLSPFAGSELVVI